MNMPPDKHTIGLIARELATEEAFIEKDWHGVQVLAAIAALVYPDYLLVFAGGTALSKAHKLIQRFSEDIDFRLHPVGHIPKRAALSKLKNSLIASLRDAGFQIDEGSIIARNDNRYFTFNIRYEKQFEHSALRPDIKVEVTLDSPKLPVAVLPVSSLVASFTQQPPEVAAITCLAYVENAADKFSAAVWRISARERGTGHDDPTLVRHLYDLALLKDAVIDDPQFVELARATMNADNERTKDGAFAALSLQEKCAHMIAIVEQDDLYPGEYENFVAGLSYASKEDTPDFASALTAFRQLAALI